MRIELIRASRRPAWPVWSVLIVGLWLALVGTAVLLSRRWGISPKLCLFKTITGKPCLTCGSTRGVLALIGGEPIKAWLFNPLVFTALPLLVIGLCTRIFLARRIRIILSKRERIIAWIAVMVIAAANWIYVILFVG